MVATESTQATRLAALRRDIGLSQRDVAALIKKAGLSLTDARISAYEKDDTIRIKMPILKQLAKIYKTSPEFIETGKHPKPTQSHPESNFVFVDTSLQELLELPFIIPAAYGSFLNSCHDRNYGDFDTVRIIKQPGVDYTGAVVLEVRGNSMAPRYPERSCHVVRPVSDGNWQHATGVHAIALRSEMFIIKRIVSNVNGILRLKSDNNGDEMEITLGDINCMWKVGEATFVPAED